jgi:hypothetical protein
LWADLLFEKARPASSRRSGGEVDRVLSDLLGTADDASLRDYVIASNADSTP